MRKLTVWHIFATNISLGGMLLFAMIFVMACLGEDNKVTVSVNDYGEMLIEIPMMVLWVGITTWNTVDRLIRFRNQRRKHGITRQTIRQLWGCGSQ